MYAPAWCVYVCMRVYVAWDDCFSGYIDCSCTLRYLDRSTRSQGRNSVVAYEDVAIFNDFAAAHRDKSRTA